MVRIQAGAQSDEGLAARSWRTAKANKLRETDDAFLRRPRRKITPARQIPITGTAEGSGVEVAEALLQMPSVPTSAGGLNADQVPSAY